MNHSPKYRLMQEGTGKRVPKGNLQPYGVYKISTYKYADGNKERLAGSEETIIFVTGIYQKKVSALKLSNIPPANFFKWFKKLTKNDSVVKRVLESSQIGLYDLGDVFDTGGNRIYDGYIKNNKDFVRKGAAYRTYNLDGIQYSTEIFFKQDTLNKYYG
jgi:hypothetical protein